ncbi:MAG: amino acid transporter [Gemmataceae bacterium]|nr:amino acid transporter [Gemmataceae bacterium]
MQVPVFFLVTYPWGQFPRRVFRDDDARGPDGITIVSTACTAPANPHPTHHHQGFWLWVMCLTGVDYFSTLAYQPSIAFKATGLLTPFATIILVGITLFGALPVYAYVAGKSPHGQGSIAMLERLVHGWTGKILVLVLLGFAATDFVITKTLSAADAAAHLLKNPLWPQSLAAPRSQLLVTMFFLVVLGATFLRGFREVIGLAVAIVTVYLVLNGIVVASSLWYLYQHPDRLFHWQQDVAAGRWQFEKPFDFGTDPWGIFFVCALLFPKLALGLSGFETGVAVMPLVRGDPGETNAAPRGRIRNTRKLLLTAAVIMSFFLLGSAMATSTLIPPEALKKEGPADDRALAYLAHGERLVTGEFAVVVNPLFGEIFGTLYDLSTVVILWFAGASAMAGLLNLVPQYLPRYGMAPEWTRAYRPLVAVFTAINLFVTWWFNADVQSQGAAYATGVLVLMSSACLACVIDRWRSNQGRIWLLRLHWPYTVITAIFFYTTAANIIERPTGLVIASWFILTILVVSIVSRFYRSKELRLLGLDFVDDRSRFLWDSLKMLEFPVLVPHRPGTRSLQEKEAQIRKDHRLTPDVPIVFIEATLGDASEFYQTPQIEIVADEACFIIRVRNCASIAHAIASLALELSKTGRPPEIHFGWSDEDSLWATIGFLLFGEGNVPWLVRELIRDAEPRPERQPRVIVG